MKNYSCLRRIILQVSALSLAMPAVPLAFGQTPPDAAATTTQPAQAPKPSAPEKKIPVENAPPSAPTDEEVLVMSPFEVTTTNKGYYSANSMSGTRMNSKIEDLGQSITVMTKEQMSDFAMRDINDVFDYMASTEGTNTYSQFTTDRTGAVVDNVSLNPTTANRVRGIGNANVAFNNIAMTGRVPVDSLWMEALELSRGPNANIFGLGNASGTVNQVPATANLTRNFTRIDMRGDSYGGWNSSLDVNRMLIKNKLSVRASYKNEHVGFVREPSGENARRLSFQIKAQPFKNTTLAVSYFGYKANSVRPNYTTPRDYYTDWISAGKPGWNPATKFVTFSDGRVYGQGNVLNPLPTGFYTSTPATGAGLTLPSWGVDNRSMFLIGAPGEAPYWTAPRYAGNPTTPTNNFYSTTDPYAASAVGIGLLETNASQSYPATIQPLYNAVARPIRDKSIYDYSKINLAANSKAWDDDKVIMAQLDQIIINTPKQTLAVQGTYLREDSQRVENQPFGIASVNSNQGQLMVDVNTANLDGSPNPYFGRPYLKTSEPFLRDKPLLWNTGRAQAAYRLDFSHDTGWSKWLGTQQGVGYYEYKDQQNRIYTYRHSALGLDKDWEQKYAYGRPATTVLNTTVTPNVLVNLPAVTPTPLGNRVQQNVSDPRYGIAPGNLARVSELYYVGSTPGGGIEYAPSYFTEGATLPYVWGPTAATMFHDVSPIGFTASPDAAGGQNNLQEVVKTTGGVWQSTFFNGRLVGTFGLREDKVYDRNGVLPTLTPNLRDFDRVASDRWASTWREALGKTKSLSLVARPFRDIKFLQSRASSSGYGFSKFLAEVATSFSLTYNKADNFIPQGPAYDLFLHPLPNQTGTSTDIGFWITAMDGKLSVRYNHFDTKQLNLRNGDITTMAQRIARYEGFVSSDAYNLRTQVSNWLAGVGKDAPPASDAQIAAAINMPLEQYQGLRTITGNNTYATVMDSRSQGHELEVNFNPTRNWTVSASVTKTEATNTAAGSAVDDYIAARMPIWTTLEDPRFTYTGTTVVAGVSTANYTFFAPNTVAAPVPFSIPITAAAPVIPNGANGHLLWWQIFGTPFNAAAGYANSSGQSAATNYAGNVNAPMSVFREMIGRPLPQIREYSAKFSTKYNLAGITEQKFLKKVSVGGSLRYASKAAIGYYGLGYDPSLDLSLPQNSITKLDVNRPIYSSADTHVDLFITYNTKMWRDRIRASFQFNVKNVEESGNRLQATQAFMDGSRATYRIVDPRQFVLSASFEL